MKQKLNDILLFIAGNFVLFFLLGMLLFKLWVKIK